MRFIGLDAGSVSVKYVVLDENGTKLNSRYVRHKGHPLKIALEMLKSVTHDALCVTSFKDSPIHPFTPFRDASLRDLPQRFPL